MLLGHIMYDIKYIKTYSTYMNMDCSIIIKDDAAKAIQELPPSSIQCIVTSPPYWGLRDYGIDGQIGLERDLQEYISKLVSIFSDARKVLKPNGILWLNIGDGYTSGNRRYRAPDKKNPARAMNVRPLTPDGLKPKDLLGIPWRLAFALQADGWYLRSDIIWNKPNAMPESVKDRSTRSHEYIFMLTKDEQYFYDYYSIKEQNRNKRTVWNINTVPFTDAHFATFPSALIEPCILSSTKPGDIVLDPFFGSGTVGVVCHKLNRKFIGIELNNDYIDIARKRLDNIEIPLINMFG